MSRSSSDTEQDVGLAADVVAADLRRRITEATLVPGTPLRDAGVAIDYAVSRHTAREALRILRTDGLVEHHRNRGVSVRRLAESDIRDLYAVRRVMEIHAVMESDKAETSAIDRLENAAATAEARLAELRWGAAGTASLVFHQELVATLQSPTLDQFFAIVIARLRLALGVMPDEPAFHKPWIARDREIVELIRRSPTDAAAALRHYLDDSESAVIDALRNSNAHPRSISRRD